MDNEKKGLSITPLLKRTTKKGKSFSGEEFDILHLEMDKGYFKDNFEGYEDLKRLNEEAKVFNTDTFNFMADAMEKESGEHDYIEGRIPMGTSPYSNLTVKLKTIEKDGEKSSRFSYKANPTDVLPSKSLIKGRNDALAAKALKDLAS